MTGRTRSTEFPVTPDALYSERRDVDCFLWVFDPTSLEVVFSTYFGGSDSDYPPNALHLADDGIWLAARTFSADVPVTDNAFQQTLADTNEELGDVMIAGISLNPPAIVYCTYVGGGGIDIPYSLAVEDSVFFVAGETWSPDFPVSPDAYDTTGPEYFNDTDGFIVSLNWRTGEYRGTYIGGNTYDRIVKNTFKPTSESITVLGLTLSTDFPVTADAYQSTLRGDLDAFVIKLDRDLTTLLYGTYIGGSAEDQYYAAYVENEDSLWTVGVTLSIDFPTTPDALQPGDNGLTSGFVQHFTIDTTADTTDAVEHRPLATEFALSAFPNPFNSNTTLSFTLLQSAEIEMFISNLLGQKIEELHFGRMDAGRHELRIDASEWASGIYFATLAATTYSHTTKLLLLR